MYGLEMATRKVGFVEVKSAAKLRRSVVALLFMAAAFWLGLAVTGNAGSGFPEDDPDPQEIKAGKFIVVDNKGNERAEFGMLKDNRPGMILWNMKDNMAFSVSLDDTGMPRMEFANSKGDSLLDLGISGEKAPILMMRDANGVRRLAMVLSPEGTVGLTLYDTKKQNRMSLSLDDKGISKVILRDEAGKGRVSLMADDTHTGALDLWDRDGQVRFSFQVDGQGHADCVFFGPDGAPTWSAKDR
jgi:hypothetical protein